MSKRNKAIAIIGAIAVLVFLWLIFATVNDVQQSFNTQFINPATANTTAIASDNGTVPNFNSFQNAIGSSLWWIISLGIVIVAVVVISNAGDSNG